ncbi:hypothetical protein DB346_11540 [Verrucomicrobia bacterium LW23]|nr:hypothetical protein DB346_11540 [Verrucomicrobia bacterium LW23]
MGNGIKLATQKEKVKVYAAHGIQVKQAGILRIPLKSFVFVRPFHPIPWIPGEEGRFERIYKLVAESVVVVIVQFEMWPGTTMINKGRIVFKYLVTIAVIVIPKRRNNSHNKPPDQAGYRSTIIVTWLHDCISVRRAS